MYKNYFLKNTWKNIIYIYIYINKLEEKKITEEEHIPLLDFKQNILGFALFL